MKEAPAPLLSWIANPRRGHGIRFARPDGAWDFFSYPDLSQMARHVAAGLIGCGVPAGSVVCIALRSSPDFVATFFGVMLAGCTPSPVAPPLSFQDQPSYLEHAGGLLRMARPAIVVAEGWLVDLLRGLTDVAVTEVDAVRARAGRAVSRHPADVALLQFTSGSSGMPRGVRITQEKLISNIDMIREWLRMTPGDATASWLPVYHDMGLVGCLLTPIVNRSDVWLMRPEHFLHRPLRYLTCFAEYGATLTAMPNFGLSYVVSRVRPEQLRGWDFSRWRAIIVGSERLGPDTFEAFERLFSPHGFARRAILPAYGLAEATLAVTGLPLGGEGWKPLRVNANSLAFGRKIVLSDRGEELVGCGRSLSSTKVVIQDSDGDELPESAVGEIVVSGPSVCAGVGLRTGDAGFLHGGQLYVLGRLGDGMKVRGVSVFAEDLEMAMGCAGVPPLRVVALLGDHGGCPTVVALFERARPEWLEAAARVLRHRAEGARVVLVNAPRGTIARTGSGKPKRRRMWQEYVNGRLTGQAVRQGLDTGGKDAGDD